MIGADFIRHRITPLHNKGRPTWLFRNAADFMVMGHAHFCQRLFHLDVNHDGRAARTCKAAKAGKVAKGPFFGLLAGVVPLSNNSRQSDIIAMMPEFNAHGLVPN